LKEAFFGRAIAYWVLNRNRVTYWGNVVTQLLMADIAVALPNSITRSVRRASGFVQVPFGEVSLPACDHLAVSANRGCEPHDGAVGGFASQRQIWFALKNVF
jgi:hypothetical protein